MRASIGVVADAGTRRHGRSSTADAAQLERDRESSSDVEEARTCWDDLAAAEAIVFGAPAYMASAGAR
jgi:hypothetical protein